jgi:hypothetical protein
MASDLRAKLHRLACDADPPSDEDELELFALDCARLALESLPCGCFDNLYGPDVTCDRCQSLASLASEGKGG